MRIEINVTPTSAKIAKYVGIVRKAASDKTNIFTKMEKQILNLTVFITFFDISIAFGNSEMSLFKKTTPADSVTTLFLRPIAIPQSALARDGASLIPSPMKAVVTFFFLYLF